jgi:hypothetical protein
MVVVVDEVDDVGPDSADEHAAMTHMINATAAILDT